MCDTKLSDSSANNICEDQYGSWLRASRPKGDRKQNNGGYEMGKQVIVNEVQGQRGKLRIEDGAKGKKEGERNQLSSGKTTVSDPGQNSLLVYNECTGQEEGGMKAKAGGEPGLDSERHQELNGGVDNSLGGPSENEGQRDTEREGVSMGVGRKGIHLIKEGQEEMMELEMVNSSGPGERNCL